MEQNPETAAKNAALNAFTHGGYTAPTLSPESIRLISEAIAAAISAYEKAKSNQAHHGAFQRTC